METVQSLMEELAEGYSQGKYDEKYLKEKIGDVLNFALPKISTLIKNREEDPVKIWSTIREDKRIDELSRNLSEKVERRIVIYVISKFKNNQYFGRRIIEEALKCK